MCLLDCVTYFDRFFTGDESYLFRYQKLLFDMGRIEKGEQIVMNFNTADDTKGKESSLSFSLARHFERKKED